MLPYLRGAAPAPEPAARAMSVKGGEVTEVGGGGEARAKGQKAKNTPSHLRPDRKPTETHEHPPFVFAWKGFICIGCTLAPISMSWKRDTQADALISHQHTLVTC